jgi:hypothetical protein
MRQSLNENPKVQIAVVAVLLLVVGFMLMTRVMGGSGGEAPPPAPVDGSAASSTGATTAGTVSGAPTASTAPATGVTPTASPAGSVPTAAPTGTVSPEALEPGPGFPAPVAAAWERGDAIVLLIVKNGGTDDELVKGSVAAISNPGVAVFVTTAGKIARYSRITQGVGVSQVPALVVVRPKGVSGKVPEATVSYGFRKVQSVVQAVNDALYRGPDGLPYSPR